MSVHAIATCFIKLTVFITFRHLFGTLSGIYDNTDFYPNCTFENAVSPVMCCIISMIRFASHETKLLFGMSSPAFKTPLANLPPLVATTRRLRPRPQTLTVPTHDQWRLHSSIALCTVGAIARKHFIEAALGTLSLVTNLCFELSIQESPARVLAKKYRRLHRHFNRHLRALSQRDSSRPLFASLRWTAVPTQNAGPQPP